MITSKDRINDGSFEKLIASINLQSRPIKIIIGLRDCSIPIEISDKVSATIMLPLKISLSAARNQVIASHPPQIDDWVCFPDDDCWYPEDLLSRVESAAKGMDYVLGVIDTGQKDFKQQPGSTGMAHIGLQNALKNSASAALFIKGSKFGRFLFDERLGLGAEVGSAEDLDLVLHLINTKCVGGFSTDIRVSHPYKPQRDNEYFEGSIAALSKFFGKIQWARLSAFRRVVKGLALASIGRLPIGQAWRGVRYFVNKW